MHIIPAPQGIFNMYDKTKKLLLNNSNKTLMKVLLDIKDDKAAFFMELLKNFSFVKAQTLTPTKAQFLKDLQGAVEEVTLAKQGKIKLQSAKDFLNEL